MEYVDELCTKLEFDQYGEENHFAKFAAEKLKTRPRYVVAGGLVACLLLLFVPFVRVFITMLITFIYPAYKSFKAVESIDEKDDIRWLTYWIVFGFMHCFEEVLSPLLFFLPFFGVFRTILLVYLHVEKEKGSKFVFDTIVSPAFGLIIQYLGPYMDVVDHTLNPSPTHKKDQ